MKQRITISQLQELTPSQQDKLRSWWEPQNGDCFVYSGGICEYFIGECGGFNHDCEDEGASPEQPESSSLPLLSIGQCIELLFETTQTHWYEDLYIGTEISVKKNWDCFIRHGYQESSNPELIDALWEVVKSIL